MSVGLLLKLNGNFWIFEEIYSYVFRFDEVCLWFGYENEGCLRNSMEDIGFLEDDWYEWW